MMKKTIGIVTLFYKNYNYGGQLQTFAMQKLFENMGFNSKVITFKPNRFFYYTNRVFDLGLIDTIDNIRRKIKFKKFLKGDKELYSLYQKRIKNFDKFISEIPQTKLYSDSDLKKDDPFDCYVCGSDQVWNPAWWNNILMLGFTNKPKFAYAASIAREYLTNYQVRYLQKKLKNYIGVSTREQSAQLMLQSILQRKVEFCLDPTLLIEKTVWREMSVAPEIDEKYILIYNLGNSTSLVDNICIQAENKGYKVVFIGFGHNTYFMTQKQKESIMIMDAGPREWLGWINNADYIITDSFHGTVFSILFKRKFWCIEKDKDRKNNENTRLYSLLENLNVKERLLRDLESFDMSASINYENVEQRLVALRKHSFAYIDSCLTRAFQK